MTKLAQVFVDAMTGRLPRYLDDLKAMTSIDCGTHNKAGIDRVVQLLADRLSDAGAEVEIKENAEAGNDVVGRLYGRGSRRVLLLCHSDTVYPDGTAASRPYRVEGDSILAPGVCDMKAGILTALNALFLLGDAGFDDFAGITLLCTSDEEAPPRHSVELIKAAAREVDAVFCMEPARANGDMVSARKGVVVYTLVAKGREAHAGVQPEMGRSAVVALASRVCEIWKLNGLRPGLTVNPGIFRGGTAANTVAGEATCVLDLRVARTEDIEAFESAIQETLSASVIPDIEFDLTADVAMPPMEKTHSSQRLVDLAVQAAAEVGFPVTDTSTGGGSDGAYAASTGTPVLDGLGPVGGQAHSEREYVVRSTIVPRTAMLARLITFI